MLMTIAGAMSTAELGISLAEMIRRDKVHLIVCTGANLEEDIFNLVAHIITSECRITGNSRRGRGATARPAHESRDRHVHPGDGGDEAD
jgi:deoxyhypusine synthase